MINKISLLYIFVYIPGTFSKVNPQPNILTLDEQVINWSFNFFHIFSLHSNSQLDINIKGQMIRDLMNIAGFRIPDKADVLHSNSVAPSATEFRWVSILSFFRFCEVLFEFCDFISPRCKVQITTQSPC